MGIGKIHEVGDRGSSGCPLALVIGCIRFAYSWFYRAAWHGISGLRLRLSLNKGGILTGLRNRAIPFPGILDNSNRTNGDNKRNLWLMRAISCFNTLISLCSLKGLGLEQRPGIWVYPPVPVGALSQSAVVPTRPFAYAIA
jgi:hypothetical protein